MNHYYANNSNTTLTFQLLGKHLPVPHKWNPMSVRDINLEPPHLSNHLKILGILHSLPSRRARSFSIICMRNKITNLSKSRYND